MADEYNRAVGGATNCNWWEPSPTRRTTSSSVIDSAATDPHSLQMIGLGLSSHQPIHPHWNATRDDAGDVDDDQIISGGFRSLVQERMPFLPAGDPSPEFNSIRGSPAAAAFSHSSSSVDSSSHGGGLPSPTFLTPLDSASGFFQGLIASSPASDHQSGFGYNQPAGGYSDNLMGWSQFLKPNSMAEAKPIQPQLMNVNTHGSFWSAAAAAMADPRPAPFFPVAPPLLQPPQMAVPSFNEKRKNNMMEVKNTSGAPGRKISTTTSGSNRTSSTATASTTSTGSAGTTAKRSRNEASSAALPPFKVRKEKMGDRITALQQLVSPFGKTDTASVLSEAIEYIKFLHEQVNVLSTPYLKSGASLQHQQSHGKFKDQDQAGARQDLRSRGLCLVPVSSTFPVAHETTVDFWTPTFGPPGAYR